MATKTGGRDLKATQSYPIKFGLALAGLSLDLIQHDDCSGPALLLGTFQQHSNLRYREDIQDVKDRRRQEISLMDIDLSKSQPEDRGHGMVFQVRRYRGQVLRFGGFGAEGLGFKL